jgi:orotate phosphoribosyltransferase-like protein
MSDDRAAQVIELRKRGVTVRGIARELGIPRSTVHPILERPATEHRPSRRRLSVQSASAQDCARKWHEVVAAQHAVRVVCGAEAADFAETYALTWVQWWCYAHGVEAPDTLPQLTDYIEP